MKVYALVMAAGRAVRFGGSIPKQWVECAGRPLLSHTLAALAPHVEGTCVVIHPEDCSLYDRALRASGTKAFACVGGNTRQISVRNGLEALESLAPDIVLIHDGARPFLSSILIARAIDAAARYGAAVPALPVTDTIKEVDGERILLSLDRTRLRAVQTPQAFRFDLILAAHRAAQVQDQTDDAAVVADGGYTVHTFAGEAKNVKITTMEDLQAAALRLTPADIRVGQGFDVHAFAQGDALWLAGIKIPHTHRLEGHSDADVVIHAICDAIYGALGEGDIGTHFPPSHMQWKDAASSIFLEHAVARVKARGGLIAQIDINLIAEAPRIGPYREAMRERLAQIAGIAVDRVGIKATTAEKLGFVGRREGIACMALATLRLP